VDKRRTEIEDNVKAVEKALYAVVEVGLLASRFARARAHIDARHRRRSRR
jgi:hypothetical protein